MKDKPSGVLQTEQPLINDKWLRCLTHTRVFAAVGRKKCSDGMAKTRDRLSVAR